MVYVYRKMGQKYTVRSSSRMYCIYFTYLRLAEDKTSTWTVGPRVGGPIYKNLVEPTVCEAIENSR